MVAMPLPIIALPVSARSQPSDVVHGPNAYAHGSRSAYEPGKTHSATCRRCPSCEVKCGVGGENRDYDGKRDKPVIVRTSHRHIWVRHGSVLPVRSPQVRVRGPLQKVRPFVPDRDEL